MLEWDPLVDLTPELPSVWTPEYVTERLLEAYDTIKLMPIKTGHGNITGAGYWPKVLREWQDAVGAEETRDKSEWSWGRGRTSPPAYKIQRMLDALGWGLRYLKGNEHEALYLTRWLLCKSMSWNFNRELKKRKWSEATAWRRRNAALRRIADGLIRDKIPVT